MAKNKRDILMDKLKMHDVGEKPKKYEGSVPCCSDRNIYYPSLYLNVEQVPELSGKDVGDEVTFLVKGKIRSHSLNENVKSGKKETFDLDIKKMGMLK